MKTKNAFMYYENIVRNGENIYSYLEIKTQD